MIYTHVLICQPLTRHTPYLGLHSCRLHHPCLCFNGLLLSRQIIISSHTIAVRSMDRTGCSRTSCQTRTETLVIFAFACRATFFQGGDTHTRSFESPYSPFATPLRLVVRQTYCSTMTFNVVRYAIALAHTWNTTNLVRLSRGSAPSDLFGSKSSFVKCSIHTPEVDKLDPSEKRRAQILPVLLSHRITIHPRSPRGARKRSRCCGMMRQVCVAHWRGISAGSSALAYDRDYDSWPW